MIIARSMNPTQLRALMGGAYTEHDAKRFRDILVEAGYSGVDSSYIVNTARYPRDGGMT
ncbi:MAG: hypothetical protein ACRCTI_16070 [Beijerinckiaceae bacterium]